MVIGTESWLTKDVSYSDFFPPTYKIYNCDLRDGISGGVFLEVESHTASHELTYIEIEILWCTMNQRNDIVFQLENQISAFSFSIFHL